MQECRHRDSVDRDQAGRFGSGNRINAWREPWKKGKRGVRSGSFKSGHKRNALPIGSERFEPRPVSRATLVAKRHHSRRLNHGRKRCTAQRTIHCGLEPWDDIRTHRGLLRFVADRTRVRDEYIVNGWYTIGHDTSGEFDSLFVPMLDPGDEVIGWQALPKWADAAPVALLRRSRA